MFILYTLNQPGARFLIAHLVMTKSWEEFSGNVPGPKFLACAGSASGLTKTSTLTSRRKCKHQMGDHITMAGQPTPP